MTSPINITSATIIGAGGTGQYLIPSLVRLLKYHTNGTTDVAVYDGDEFESHNAERQIGVSGPKTDVLERLLYVQGLRAVELQPKYMTRQRLSAIRNADRQVGGCRLVVAAVDNDATRKMCIDTLLDKPGDFLFVSPGNSDTTDIDSSIKASIVWFGRIGDQTVGINPALLFPNIEQPEDYIPHSGPDCVAAAPSTPQLIPANALAAAYTLTVIQNFLDGRMPFEASHCFVNGRNFTTSAN